MVKRTPSAAISLLVLASSLASSAAAERLPTTIAPDRYDLKFTVDLAGARFDGTETIHVQVKSSTTTVTLNAAELTFQDATIGTGSNAQKAQVSLNAGAQTATLSVPKPLAAGPADIHIAFRGILNDELRGFYLSKSKTRNYAVTQFEATDARRAFPCFDEPEFKAAFAVTLVVDKRDTAISNGRIESDTPGPGPDQHTLVFTPSPKMSSYLVAMAVGDFECLSGSADDVPIRICTTPGKKELGHIALGSAEQILKFYDSYYAIKYPFGKLDVLAVPDFAAGAMENTGAIFYRETDLLADTHGAAVTTRKTIASVLAHEMAHQWFGDLVTMRWWDDIWLNEGFATWMANKPLAALHREWNIAVDEALENETALGLDSLQATRPIHAAANTPAEIDEAFDAIAYQKGAAVLRMIEHYVGDDVFRNGVNAYLRAHAYGNAAAPDFWSAIAAAASKPVDAIMPTFVNQPGVPLVTVSTTCDAAKTSTRGALTQNRFTLGPPVAERWQIPVCPKAEGSPEPGACLIVDKPEQVVPLARGCPSWVFLNGGARGYFRTEYPTEMLRALAPEIETGLTAPERIVLMDDEWALIRAGRHSIADYMTLASGFRAESSAGALQVVTDRLGMMHEYLTTDATRPAFESVVRGLLQPIFRQVGFASAPSDSDERRELRAVVVGSLGASGNDPDVIARSRVALDAALAGSAPLDPTLAEPVTDVAAGHGDARLFDALTSAADRATSPEDHYRYLNALSEFTDPALADRALRMSLSPQMRSQDTAIYLAHFLGNPAANARAWAFVKANWKALEPKVTIYGGDTNLVSALGSFCDAGARDDIKAFFAAHKLPSAARGLQQTVERIDNCIALRQKQMPILATWLSRAR
jgi:aminopeptidase N